MDDRPSFTLGVPSARYGEQHAFAVGRGLILDSGAGQPVLHLGSPLALGASYGHQRQPALADAPHDAPLRDSATSAFTLAYCRRMGLSLYGRPAVG